MWRAAAASLTAAILVMLLLPAGRLPSASVALPDKLVHAALFFFWALSCHRAGLPLRDVVIWGLVLAGLTELGQGLMAAGRQADLGDAGADVVGVLLGVGLSGGVRASDRSG